MRIALIFNKERADTVGVYFARALTDLNCKFDHFWTKDTSGIKQDYDLYLRIDHGDYKYDIPDNLHPSAFYVIDANVRHAYRKIKEQVGHYDFVFCLQRSLAQEFKSQRINAFWLPLACDPHIHRNLSLAKTYDVGFVGTEGGIPRKFILQELRERFPNSFIGQTPFTEMGKIYSQAKIGFHFIGTQTKYSDSLSMRFFEILGCGTMLLANQVTGESLDILGFKDRKHLVLYKEIKQIFPLIEYYLKHEPEREEIARSGYQLAIAKHTYTQRAKTIINIIKNKFNLSSKWILGNDG